MGFSSGFKGLNTVPNLTSLLSFNNHIHVILLMSLHLFALRIYFLQTLRVGGGDIMDGHNGHIVYLTTEMEVTALIHIFPSDNTLGKHL